jgi:hypothetical protein
MLSLISRLKKKNKKKSLDKKIISYIEIILKKLKTKKIINFVHSGHLGDLINSLPVIKEISKNSKCNLFINLNKKLNKKDINELHPSKANYLNLNSFNKLKPLLKKQSYLLGIEVYENQLIDVDLDFFRELPLNFNLDSVRWYSHLTGVNPDLSKPYLLGIKENKKYKKSIVFMRSLRRQNNNIEFNFLKKYKNLVFIGLHNEYLDLKKQISNLKFHECKDFLEMAEIIKSSKLFIGNLSFGYTLAEALKKPRLLESYLDFPLVYPNGLKGYEFYFQKHFEKYVGEILKH